MFRFFVILFINCWLVGPAALFAFDTTARATTLITQTPPSNQGFPTEVSGIDLRSMKKVALGFSDKVPKANLSNKALVIVFLSAKCPCSQSHEKPLSELEQNFSKKGFVFVGIHSNADETSEFAHNHFSKSDLSFPILQDQDLNLANQFKALKTPHTFVVSPKGDILYSGGVDDSARAENAKQFYLKDALESLSKGEAPLVRTGRALGCVISRN